jgi:guanylate kinase
MMFAERPSETSFEHPARPLLIVLSGPSGAGKDAVLHRLKALACPLDCIVTMTTRPKRDYERDGVDYHFVSTEQFQAMLTADEFLEWARVYGNWYGLPKQSVREALSAGRDVIVKVDVQGAATIKRKAPAAVFIFLIPPTPDELVRRLRERHTESEADLAVRTRMASEELKCLPAFDYIVVNRQNRLDEAVAEIKAIIAAEKCRVSQREITL